MNTPTHLRHRVSFSLKLNQIALSSKNASCVCHFTFLVALFKKKNTLNKETDEPWPVWLSWLGVVLQTEKLPV